MSEGLEINCGIMKNTFKEWRCRNELWYYEEQLQRVMQGWQQ